ncbi:MAG: hypothetical protein HeimC3_35270 [Candidatus Heimdallarchaeota archaeon LC_3]|nr:MAG: hypothetical protein HeimC3_35270 [Candidatus Heimdallarchaeota archaeon LC_3]
MVYDFVPDKNTETHYKKYKSTFSANFIYLMLKNYLIIFLVAILIFISSNESWISLGFFSYDQIVFLTLFSILLFPLVYFIYNLGKFPDQKATYFVRLLIFQVFSLATAFSVFSLVSTDMIYYNWGNIIIVWLIIFALTVTMGNVLKINSNNVITITSKTPDHSQSKDGQKIILNNAVESYPKDDLISNLFNKKDWVYIGVYFYLVLGLSLLLLLNMSYTSDADYLIEGNLIGLFSLIFIISLFVSVLSSIFKTLYEKNTNTLLIRDLIIYRLIIYISISILLGIILLYVYSMLTGYYYSVGGIFDFSLFRYSLQLIAVWSIPLLIFLVYFYNKLIKKRRIETYDALMGSSLAKNLTRYYLLTRLSEIKTILNSTDPLDFDMKFKKTIENNISRLVESCNSNGISIKSKTGLKKYVLHIATPLRETLREAIGQNFTEIYLSDDIPSEERIINYDEVWRKINKAFLQWESGSSKE